MKNRSNNNRKKIIFLIILFVIFAFFLSALWKTEINKKLHVFFLDSDQADSIFITTPESQKIIIDLGSKKGFSELNKKNIWWDKEIDLLIITHPHDDHIWSVPDLLNRYKVKKIIFNGIAGDSPIHQEIVRQSQNKKIKLLIPQVGQKIIMGDNCELSFLYPLEILKNKSMDNLNNSSLVVQLQYDQHRFLFMGDIEEEVEKKMLAEGIKIESNVLKVGHHGSITSSHEDFIKKINPQISIIMVGENNKFSHPSLRVINRLQKIGSLVFRTDLNGTIEIISDGQTIKYNLSNK